MTDYIQTNEQSISGRNMSYNETSPLLGNEEDPLIEQLPEELREFVRYPSLGDSHKQLGFVTRSGCSRICHMACAIMCWPYSLCNMWVVRQGQIGLTQNGDIPELLPPGRHVLLSPTNKFLQIYNETEPVIQHGPIKIIQVARGKLGYGIDMAEGHPVLLAQGRHIVHNKSFIWRKFITLRAKVTKLDQIEIIRVETGNIGYCYRSGELDILKPGLHLITPPDRFVDFLSTQICILDLPPSVHDTSDYVPLYVKSNVFYRIVDPKKALITVKNIKKQMLELSVATLAGIIRASSFSDVANRNKPFYNDPTNFTKTKTDDNEQDNDNNKDDEKLDIETNFFDDNAPSAPPFFQHVHDEFIGNIQDHVLSKWGIEIQNIRIEKLKIHDRNLQTSISNQAINVQKQHNQYTMLEKQQMIVTVEAQTRSMKKKIEADMNSLVLKENAKCDSDCIILKAKAKKEVKTLQGQGEKEYSTLIESTKLGKNMATMKIQSEALQGLKQISYVPHLNNILGGRGGVIGINNELVLPNDEAKDGN